MNEQTLFYLVFIGQILLISVVQPRGIVARMRLLRQKFPPATYPKLYPKSAEYYESKMLKYRALNTIIALVGAAILIALVLTARTGDWDHVIATAYFLLQVMPYLFLDFSSRRELQAMRDENTSSLRGASMRPRYVSDYVSKGLLSLFVGVYIAFVALVIYIDQFYYPWFGGYANIVGVTVMFMLMAVALYWTIHGRKLDPHQTQADRDRQIKAYANIFVVVSIAATVFIGLSITMSALELTAFKSVMHSLYYQFLAVISVRAYHVGFGDFDVYRKDSVLT